ncbi:MAG: Na+/H+ antiporter subunit E [Actinomycetota bacterium]
MNRRLLIGTGLIVGWTAIWVALWRDLSAANVLAGAIVANLLLLKFPPRAAVANQGYVSPGAVLRFVAFLIKEILKANVIVAWEVLTPWNTINEGIVAIPIRGVSEGLVTLVANCISLSPGTLTLETRSNPSTIYVHVLHLRDVEVVRRNVQHLEKLAIEAFGSDEAVELLRTQEGDRT